MLGQFSGGVVQDQQEAACGAKLVKAREVVFEAAFEAESQLRAEVSREGGQGAAAAFAIEDEYLVEVFAIGAHELEGQGRILDILDAGAVGQRHAQPFEVGIRIAGIFGRLEGCRAGAYPALQFANLPALEDVLQHLGRDAVVALEERDPHVLGFRLADQRVLPLCARPAGREGIAREQHDDDIGHAAAARSTGEILRGQHLAFVAQDADIGAPLQKIGQRASGLAVGWGVAEEHGGLA